MSHSTTTPPMPTTRWEPDRAARLAPWQTMPMGLALKRGLRCTCPACGETRLFSSYLKVVPECTACGAPLGQVRADDAPPYFTIVLVGHIVVPLMLFVEKTWSPSLWLQAALWLPLTLGLTLAFLQPIKGATVGLMLRLGMTKPPEEA